MGRENDGRVGGAARPYAAAATEDAIRAAGGGRVVKLNSNENPLGPGQAALAAAREAVETCHRYPPGLDEALCSDIADHHGVDPDRVVVTGGSVELLGLLLSVACRPGRDMALAFMPCFPAFIMRARAAGVALGQIPLNDDFSHPLGALAQAADETTAVAYLANPDNPTGRAVLADEIVSLAGQLPERTLLVVDEAYADFADEPEELSLIPRLGGLPNVAVTRTFSKAHGLAGLRVGYGIVPKGIAGRIRALQLSFTVTAQASAAARAALMDEEHFESSVVLAREGREYLLAELGRLGCAPVPSQGPFVMFRPGQSAARVHEALMTQGVAVRPLGYAGLPDRLRVSCGTMEENRLFILALEEALAD